MVENSPVGSTLLKKVDEELVEGAEEVLSTLHVDHHQVSQTWNTALALAVRSSPVQQFGIGFGVGWLSGYLFRRVSKTAAFLLGCSFVVYQGAATLGLVKVNWRRVNLAIQDHVNRTQILENPHSPLTLNLINFCHRHVYITSGFTTGAVIAITF